MPDLPDNLTDMQRLVRMVDRIAHDVNSARWYIGFLCFIAGIALVFFLLWLFGVFTVEIKLQRF